MESRLELKRIDIAEMCLKDKDNLPLIQFPWFAVGGKSFRTFIVALILLTRKLEPLSHLVLVHQKAMWVN